MSGVRENILNRGTRRKETVQIVTKYLSNWYNKGKFVAEKATPSIVVASSAIYVSDALFKRPEPFGENPDELDEYFSVFLDYSMNVVTVLTFIPLFRFISAGASILYKGTKGVIALSSALNTTVAGARLAALPFVSVASGGRKAYDAFRKSRVLKKGASSATFHVGKAKEWYGLANKQGEIFIQFVKKNSKGIPELKFSPKLSKKMAILGISVTGGTAAGLEFLIDGIDPKTKKKIPESELYQWVEEWLQNILWSVGFEEEEAGVVNRSEETVDYEKVAGLSKGCSTLNLISDYEYHKDRAKSLCGMAGGTWDAYLLSRIADDVAPVVLQRAGLNEVIISKLLLLVEPGDKDLTRGPGDDDDDDG
jgi:hypothetical protein